MSVSATNKLVSSFQGSTDPISVKVVSLTILSDTDDEVPHLRIEVKEADKKKISIPFPIYLTSQAKAKLKSEIDILNVDQELRLTNYTISNLITENMKKGKPLFIVADLEIS